MSLVSSESEFDAKLSSSESEDDDVVDDDDSAVDLSSSGLRSAVTASGISVVLVQDMGQLGSNGEGCVFV